MKTRFKLTPAAALVGTALLMTGCNSDSEQASVSQAPAPAKTASVALAAKFPTSDVSAAWIGDASEIEVRFYRNRFVGSLDEAEDMVDALDECHKGGNSDYDNLDNNGMPNDTHMIGDQELPCYELPHNALRERYAAEAFLNPNSPTSSVDLEPGKFRIEAHFKNADGSLRETSVSYATLSEGEHQVVMKGVSATWTADTPLTLQLLNRESEVDFDPLTDGVQTAAQVLGITGDIVGVHLPSLYQYPGSVAYNWRLDAYSLDTLLAKQESEQAMATVLVPVWRMASDSGEVNLYQQGQHHELKDDSDETVGWYSVTDSLAGLFQQYVAGQNHAAIELGSKSVYLAEHGDDPETGQWTEREMFADVLMGVVNVAGDEEVEREIWDSFELSYYDWTLDQQVDSGITVANIHTESEENPYADLFLNVLSASENSFVGGNTINGYLVEVLEETISSGQDARPAMYLDAALNEIAQAQGLIAQANNDASCTPVELSYQDFASEYRWDVATQTWVAGTRNPYSEIGQVKLNVEYNTESYVSWEEDNIVRLQQDLADRESELAIRLEEGATEDDVAWLREEIARLGERVQISQTNITELQGYLDDFYTKADLNGDGVIELFEDGVFIDDYWADRTCQISSDWDANTQSNVYSYFCDSVNVADVIGAWVGNVTGEMCVQPFSLTASQLSIEYQTGGEVVIE